MGGIPNRGLSPVVGVIVLIGLVIILSAVLFIGVSDLATSGSEPAPVLGLDVEFEHQNGSLVGMKLAGEDVDTDNLEIVGPGEAVFDSDQLSTGEQFEVEIHEPGGELTLVYTDDDRTDTIITSEENPIVGDLGGLPSNITMAYEDLPADDSDYDYADWVVGTETQIQGFETDDGKFAQQVEIEFTPRAAHSIYNHDQSIVPEDLGSGEYELTVYDADGNEDQTESDSFDSDDEIMVMNSKEAFPELDNDWQDIDPLLGTDDLQCDPEATATLTLDLDDATRIPDDPINETHQHGSGLPYNPQMETNDPHGFGVDETVEADDNRLLTVQEDWQWPEDGVHIANAYEDVLPEDPDDEGDEPTFEERTWFENPEDEDLLNSCD